MMMIVHVLNALVSIGSLIAAMIALFSPSTLSGSKSVSAGERLFVALYAARSVPLELSAGALPFIARGPVVAWIVVLAAIVQAIDAFIGLRRRQNSMVGAATVAAMVHFVCGYVILMSPSR